MANDLNELHERIAWCRQRAAELDTEIVRLSGQCIKYWREGWGQGSAEIKAKMLSPPPVSIRVEVGTLVNEQRAILDALACALATRNGANHTNDVYFPITRDKEGFEQLGRKKIRKLGQADQEKIEALSPWALDETNGGNQALSLLHEADRIRKHQKLLKWGCLGGVFPVGDGHVGQMSLASVLFETVGAVETLATYSHVTTGIGVRFSLVYNEPGSAIHGCNVSPALHAFNNTVSDIVSSFA
jgi:hypothetical protein